MSPGSLSKHIEPGLLTGLEFTSKTRNGVFIFVTSFHQGDLHHNLQAVLCVMTGPAQDPLCSLRYGLLPGCLSAALGSGILLSLPPCQYLSFPLGLADSCVFSEPLSWELVGPLSQTENPSPEDLQGPLPVSGPSGVRNILRLSGHKGEIEMLADEASPTTDVFCAHIIKLVESSSGCCRRNLLTGMEWVGGFCLPGTSCQAFLL